MLDRGVSWLLHGQKSCGSPRLQQHSLMLAQHLMALEMCLSVSLHVILGGKAYFRDGEIEALVKGLGLESPELANSSFPNPNPQRAWVCDCSSSTSPTCPDSAGEPLKPG